MTIAVLKPQPVEGIAEAARQLGRLGGRPKGSYSSPLAKWLRSEIRKRQREGYGCREAFRILADTENSTGRDAFTVTDWTADAHDLDIGARVTWNYWRRLWQAG
jgi:hypothetical protein